MPLNSPVENLKGVGEKRLDILNKMGIYTIGDLLHHAPFKYQEISKINFLSKLSHGDNAVVKATISSKPVLRRFKGRFSIVSFSIDDGNSSGKCVFYNQPYIAKNLLKDSQYIFIGKIDCKRGVKEIQNPVMIKDEKELLPVICSYRLPQGMGQKAFVNLIKKALEKEDGTAEETLPASIRKKYNLPEINFTLENIHFPDSIETANKAKFRIAFEEILLFMLVVEIKKDEQTNLKPNIFKADEGLVDRFVKSLSFALTKAQGRVIQEIIADMEKPLVMNRLLQGDVGSGKTIPAAVAMLIAAENKKQSAMMAPTEILANQHFYNISELLKPYGIKTELLKSKLPSKEKREILGRIKSGETDVIIGTHSLIQENTEYNNLGLVITDEQHRFGVAQRAKAFSKGDNPDMLVMSATPVPRSLALILYGDLDISIIDELPPGRLPIQTRIVNSDKRFDMYRYIKENLSGDNRAYIVCPSIDESESMDIMSTEELLYELKDDVFKNIEIAVLHGRQKDEEKQSLMDKFRAGEIKCLISTTVIEVGIDVPEASFIVIENAERFGLAQLHQLRGRVGRGNNRSWCFLVSSTEGKDAKNRLQIMTKSNDGFVIAEEDLKLRGPGQFVGFRQSGMMDPKAISLMGDVRLLSIAKNALEDLNTPELKDAKKKLVNLAQKKYKSKIDNIIMN